MTEQSPTAEHLSVAMTTKEADNTSSSSSIEEFYFRCAVVFIGVVGTASNALILYALVVSKQHKKHVLIVNQNALDLFSSFFLVVTYAVKLCNIRLTGTLGYWLCITILSENVSWWGTNGSIINLAIITVYRYLKVVHPIWSRKWLRPWVIRASMAFAWFAGTVYNIIVVFVTGAVIDGVCYAYIITDGDLQRKVYGVWYIASFYVIILVIFVYCYWRILVAIRRQASVMAGHSGATATAQAQSNQIQSNVIKTMVLVSGFYAITWLPGNVYYLLSVLETNMTFADSRYYVANFVSFCYISANPFIYATKFDPVRKVLPCKKSAVQPAEGAESAGLQLASRAGQERPAN